MGTLVNRIRNAAPFTSSDERHYAWMLKDMHSRGQALNVKNARQLWRIRHCVPYLETGRSRDLLNRIYEIPSTRKLNVIYHISLDEGVCTCPGFDRFRHCEHITDATIVEREKYGEQLARLRESAQSSKGGANPCLRGEPIGDDSALRADLKKSVAPPTCNG